jgi:quinol monooxygenase YgiN
MKLTIEIRANQDKFQELFQTLQALLPVMREQKGCRDCRICLDAEDSDILLLVTHWEAKKDLENYVRSESGSALLGAVDLLGRTTRVGFDRDSSWEDINILRKMRRKHGPDLSGS